LKLKFEGNGVRGEIPANNRRNDGEEQMDSRLLSAEMMDGESRQRDFAETWVVHLGTDPSRWLRMTNTGRFPPPAQLLAGAGSGRGNDGED